MFETAEISFNIGQIEEKNALESLKIQRLNK